MEVLIQFQQKSNNSNISINDREIYYTTDNKGFFVQKISLCRSSDKQMVLEGYCRLLPPKFKIILSDTTDLAFKPDGMQALNYICRKDSNQYAIFQHKDRKHSIFCNEKQIAYFDKTEISTFGADSYTLIADHDADIELLLGFLIVLHIINGSSKQNMYTKDIGNIWEKRPFDSTWKPK
jgi:hypothetical protein